MNLRNRSNSLAILAAAMMMANVTIAKAALVPITGLTASNGKNNFGGELSDLTSGEEIAKPDSTVVAR